MFDFQLDSSVDDDVIVIDETSSSYSSESTTTPERIHPRHEKKILNVNVQHHDKEKHHAPTEEDEPTIIFISDDPNDAKAESEEQDQEADVDSEQDDPTGEILYKKQSSNPISRAIIHSQG